MFLIAQGRTLDDLAKDELNGTEVVGLFNGQNRPRTRGDSPAEDSMVTENLDPPFL